MQKRANAKSRNGLNRTQVALMVMHMAQVMGGQKGVGTYRYLIYTVLKGVNYSDGMGMGLVEWNNWMGDMKDYLDKHPQIQKKTR